MQTSAGDCQEGSTRSRSSAPPRSSTNSCRDHLEKISASNPYWSTELLLTMTVGQLIQCSLPLCTTQSSSEVYESPTYAQLSWRLSRLADRARGDVGRLPDPTYHFALHMEPRSRTLHSTQRLPATITPRLSAATFAHTEESVPWKERRRRRAASKSDRVQSVGAGAAGRTTEDETQDERAQADIPNMELTQGHHCAKR